MIRPAGDFYFFWKHPFSQWRAYPMLINGVEYGCCEQYMMAEKARLFGDEETRSAIMQTSKPSKQKDFGRAVRGFDQAVWDAVAREIVYRANLAKFTQHAGIREMLLSTGDRILAEACPYEGVWGIALPEGDPRTLGQDTWCGTNWLGIALMRVRDELRAAEEAPAHC